MNVLNISDASEFVLDKKNKKVVVITGVTGQDGSLMSDYLLQNTDCIVIGGARRLSVCNHENIEHLSNNPRFHLINFDLTDSHSISQIINKLNPDYLINFAAQSFVKSSWDFPLQTWETNTTGVLHILESIRLHAPKCRFYNAGSSEEFGDVAYSPQNEQHPLRPRSPYAASKAAARQLVKVYRESYNLYAIQGWLFNHEGVRRGEEFVTRKITKGVSRIHKILTSFDGTMPIQPIELGNLDASRDWSDAEDCVDAVWRMLNQKEYNSNFTALKEYNVASGECHTIREFIEKSFEVAGISGGKWRNENLDEEFVILRPFKITLVKINPSFFRPAEVLTLLGNPMAIKTDLKWNPKTSFDQLVEKMVRRDMGT